VYGQPGAAATRCIECRMEGDIRIYVHYCECGTQASFGPPSEVPCRCSKCRLDTDVLRTKVFCECGKIGKPSFGEPGGLPRRCHSCKLDTDVNVVSLGCECGATISAAFGPPGGSPVHCPLCKDEGDVNLRSKRCSCGTIASFAPPKQSPLRCGPCRLAGDVHVRCKLCACGHRANWGTAADGALRCGQCRQTTDIDLSSGRCVSEACVSAFQWAERSKARMKTPDGWFCYGCVLGKYPQMLQLKVRKEQFVLAELQRRLPEAMAAAKMILWDCRVPGGCSLKQPDLLMSFDDRYLHVEVDEFGHASNACIDEDQRLAVIAADVSLPGLVLRLNPDVAGCTCFTKVQLASGEFALEAVKPAFELLMARAEAVVKRFLKGPTPDTVSIAFVDSHPDHAHVCFERVW